MAPHPAGRGVYWIGVGGIREVTPWDCPLKLEAAGERTIGSSGAREPKKKQLACCEMGWLCRGCGFLFRTTHPRTRVSWLEGGERRELTPRDP